MKDRQWLTGWKDEIIAAALLLGFAFFINRGIEIKGHGDPVIWIYLVKEEKNEK